MSVAAEGLWKKQNQENVKTVLEGNIYHSQAMYLKSRALLPMATWGVPTHLDWREVFPLLKSLAFSAKKFSEQPYVFLFSNLEVLFFKLF